MTSLLYSSLAIILLSYVHLAQQISLPSSLTYVAGVVEYYPQNYGTPMDTVNNRTREYISIIQSIQAADVDIIVFPEATLTLVSTPTDVPPVEYKLAPCDYTNYTTFLHDLSCAARNTRKYVVVNLYMKRNCTEDEIIYGNVQSECPASNIRLYNTNVVLDRNGTVISIYRKFNLFGEPEMTKPNVADIAVFDTDFGVRFGHFICFDILFMHPAKEILSQGVTDIIFPTMWFSELPFLTAAQVQQGWAESFNVNLLAAGASNPQVGSTGTGIYIGRNGSLGTIMAATPITRLIVASVTKKNVQTQTPTQSTQSTTTLSSIIHLNLNDDNTNHNIDNMQSIIENNQVIDVNNNNNLIREYQMGAEELAVKQMADERSTDDMLPLRLKTENLTEYEHLYLNFTASRTQNFTLCHNNNLEFCCDFDMTIIPSAITPDIYYEYFAVAHYGERSFDGVANGLVFSCAVIACTSQNFTDCGKRFPVEVGPTSTRYTYSRLNITSSFNTNDDITSYPNSLNMYIMPFHPNEYEYNRFNQSRLNEIKMNLLNPRVDLYTFGFYGRAFTGGSSRIYVTLTLLLISILLSIYNIAG